MIGINAHVWQKTPAPQKIQLSKGNGKKVAQKTTWALAALSALPNERKFAVLEIVEKKRKAVLSFGFSQLLEQKAADYHAGDSRKIEIVKRELSDYILFGRLNGVNLMGRGTLESLLQATDPEIAVRTAIDVCHALEMGDSLKHFVDLPDETVALFYEIILVLSDLMLKGEIYLEDLKVQDMNSFRARGEIELNPIIIRGMLKTVSFLLKEGSPRRFSVLAEIWEMLSEAQGIKSSIKNDMRKTILGRAFLMIKKGYVAGKPKSRLKFTPVFHELDYEDFSENVVRFLKFFEESALAQMVQAELTKAREMNEGL